MNCRFTKFLDEMNATLVVRLHQTKPFQQDRLWRYAADFKTNARKQLGVKLNRRAPGESEPSPSAPSFAHGVRRRDLAGSFKVWETTRRFFPAVGKACCDGFQ